MVKVDQAEAEPNRAADIASFMVVLCVMSVMVMFFSFCCVVRADAGCFFRDLHTIHIHNILRTRLLDTYLDKKWYGMVSTITMYL
jgi:hypothetical protein